MPEVNVLNAIVCEGDFSAVARFDTIQPNRAIGLSEVAAAALEIAGALMLCVRRTQWPGAVVLLGVFACAQLVSALSGEWPTRFLQFAASALLIVALDRALAHAH